MTARRHSAPTQIPSSAAVWLPPCPRSVGLSWRSMFRIGAANTPVVKRNYHLRSHLRGWCLL